MRNLLLPLSLLALGACTTPQQSCINQARGELSALMHEISTTQGNITRGYAIHESSVSYTYTGVCHDFDGNDYACEKTDTRIEETPVAISIAEERRKLAALKSREARVRAQAEAAAAQCRITYPE